MLELLADANGIVLRRDAVACGVDDGALRRAVLQGRLVRVRQGAYVLRGVWESLDRLGRYRTLVAAVLRLYDDPASPVALSHTSASIEQGGPSWGLDLEAVHLTHLNATGDRTSAKLVHHRGVCRVKDITRSDGHWMTAPARTAMDTASISARDPGIAVLDYFQQRGLTTREELERVFSAMKWWPDTLGLLRVLQLSDGIAESVGETRTRLLCLDMGLPAPTPQFEIFHPSGRLAGRVDFAWPERRTMLEFDGRQKYLRLRRPSETIEQTVLREKAREDLLRELTGWLMIRLVWADLDVPEATARRIVRVFERAA
ncbi:type IV toxin-antitoxin system AbiEi family antitoxin domain-containing protein [Nocardioides stalactiti]|uniref:type IV toxin-antitoxin system AbiEi family antitoxin domain-containing protein n=1 Tax=Nocardioides stalactiti TaxID=2755356 RepID=UPI001603153A|nr:type IV toxin-antitoxin system AbiEi family antitoxin domain-containing protein [Nocardioides stalactiti]